MPESLITTRAPPCIGMQPFSSSCELLIISCSRKKFMMISRTVQEFTLTDTHTTHTHTHTHLMTNGWGLQQRPTRHTENNPRRCAIAARVAGLIAGNRATVRRVKLMRWGWYKWWWRHDTALALMVDHGVCNRTLGQFLNNASLFRRWQRLYAWLISSKIRHGGPYRDDTPLGEGNRRRVGRCRRRKILRERAAVIGYLADRQQWWTASKIMERNVRYCILWVRKRTLFHLSVTLANIVAF